MKFNEAIVHATEVASKKYAEGMLCHANPNDKELDGCIECAEEHEQLAKWLGELQQYREIGTVEECRAAVEKQIAKKPEYDKPIGVLGCPCCGNYLIKVFNDGTTGGCIPHYCNGCGQKISADWGEEE